ncbi:MAG: nucleotidyltransferase family protein [Acidimicrobiales bacterium]
MDAWVDELGALRAARLSQVALRLLAETDGDRRGAEGLDEVRVFLEAEARGLACQAMAAEAVAGAALRRLIDLGIPVLVIKGPAVARFHPEPGLRPYQDVDVVVPPRSFGAALAGLRELGYERTSASVQPWPWFDRVCLEGLNVRRAGESSIDVHHRISPWAFTRKLTADALFARSEPGEVARVPVQLASADDALAIAALHVVNDLWKGDPSIQSWRDILVLTARLGPQGSSRAYDQAGLRWLQPLVESTCAVVAPNGSVAGDAARLALRDRLRRRRLVWLGWGRDSLPARHPAGWALRLPLLRGAAFLAGSAVPSPSYARQKHGGYARYWRDSIHSIAAAIAGTDFRNEALPNGR